MLKCICNGSIICGTCQDIDCDCEITFYSCNQCPHKICNWCGNATHLKNSDPCEECCHWDCVGDPCESDFCIHYLGGNGNICENLICNACQSTLPLIRVPLAFPLYLHQIIIEYPNFEKIKSQFLKYYAYSHTNATWEPDPNSEFLLAQKYFDFDAGVIVLGRSREDETEAKNKDAIKIEKELKKLLKRERRIAKIKSRENTILSI